MKHSITLTAERPNGMLFQQQISCNRPGVLGPNCGPRVQTMATITLQNENLDNGAIWYCCGDEYTLLYTFLGLAGWSLNPDLATDEESNAYAAVKEEFQNPPGASE